MQNDQIIRLSSGVVNKVNDAVVGQQAAQYGYGGTKFAGQLGAGFWQDDSVLRYDSTIGTVYGGHFRYVRLAAASAVPIVGQLAFWSPIASFADNLYQVTADEAATSGDDAVAIAGVFLYGSITAGNYTVIQDIGPCFVKMRAAALTGTAAVGCAVIAAAAGGADVGFCDTVDQLANPATMQDVSLFLRRYVGRSRGTPVAGALALVDLNFAAANPRG